MTGLSGMIKAKAARQRPARFTPHAAPRQVQDAAPTHDIGGAGR
jgi:hypothetical protein